MSGGVVSGGPIRRDATVVWPDGSEQVLKLTEAQRDGRACVRCASLTLHAAPVGHINGAGQVFACTPSCSPDPTGTGSVETPAREGYHRRPSGPAPSSPTPVARSGDSTIKDARGPRDHQRPVSATLLPDPAPSLDQQSGSPLLRPLPLRTIGETSRRQAGRAANRVWQSPSGGPRVLGPGRVGTQHVDRPLVRLGDRRPPALSTILWWAVDLFVGGARFNGPLTTAPRLAPQPAATDPDPRPALLGHEETPAGGPAPETEGLTAWDCLFSCPGGCLNGYGEPVRAGMSCWTSARLMSLRNFETDHPSLYRIAVERGILTAEPAGVA